MSDDESDFFGIEFDDMSVVEDKCLTVFQGDKDYKTLEQLFEAFGGSLVAPPELSFEVEGDWWTIRGGKRATSVFPDYMVPDAIHAIELARRMVQRFSMNDMLQLRANGTPTQWVEIANQLMGESKQSIHERMPVILQPAMFAGHVMPIAAAVQVTPQDTSTRSCTGRSRSSRLRSA